MNLTINKFIEIMNEYECGISISNDEITVISKNFDVLGTVNIKLRYCHSINVNIYKCEDEVYSIYKAITQLSKTPIDER